MRSEFFTKLRIPDAECAIEPALHPQFPISYLFFRSPGNPLIGLDMTGASQLRQMLVQAGELDKAKEVDGYITKDRRLG